MPPMVTAAGLRESGAPPEEVAEMERIESLPQVVYVHPPKGDKNEEGWYEWTDNQEVYTTSSVGPGSYYKYHPTVSPPSPALPLFSKAPPMLPTSSKASSEPLITKAPPPGFTRVEGPHTQFPTRYTGVENMNVSAGAASSSAGGPPPKKGSGKGSVAHQPTESPPAPVTVQHIATVTGRPSSEPGGALEKVKRVLSKFRSRLLVHFPKKGVLFEH